MSKLAATIVIGLVGVFAFVAAAPPKAPSDVPADAIRSVIGFHPKGLVHVPLVADVSVNIKAITNIVIDTIAANQNSRYFFESLLRALNH